MAVSLHIPVVSTLKLVSGSVLRQQDNRWGKKEKKVLQARLEVPWQAVGVSLHRSCQHYNY